MLTNTATPDLQDHGEITATTIAIEVAERRARAALREIVRREIDLCNPADELGIPVSNLALCLARSSPGWRRSVWGISPTSAKVLVDSHRHLAEARGRR